MARTGDVSKNVVAAEFMWQIAVLVTLAQLT